MPSKKMKRILFLIPDLGHGGAEKVLVNLVNNLDQTKYEITLYSIFDCGVNREYLDKSIKYRSKFKRKFRGNSHFFKLFSPRLLYRWIVGEEYDIVVSYLEGVAARVISGCSYPTTKKVAWLHIELNDERKAKTGFRSLAEARKCYANFNKIIGVSSSVVELGQKFLGARVPYDVLYNTNETDQIRELANKPTEFNIDSEAINVCSVAKVMKTKGYDRLLEVHKRLLLEGLKHIIYIIGCGEERKKLELRAEELGVTSSFQFLGFHKNPYKDVSKCDLYVCSSRREGFSTAVTEALVLGLPVVSTDCSGAKELLGESDDFGLVVENSEEGVYQGMKRMLSEPGLLKDYRERAAARGKRFSKTATVNAVESMLDNL